MLYRSAFAALCSILLFPSCHSHLDSSQLAEINEGFTKADHFIRADNDRLCGDIYRRQYDPQMRYGAVVWLPAVFKARSIDSTVERYLDSIKGKLGEPGELSRDGGLQVTRRFTGYERNMVESLNTVRPNVSEQVRKDMDEMKLHLAARRDSLLLTGQISISPEMLSKLALDLHLLENYVLSYCNKMASAETIDSYEKYTIIASLENGHLRPGEPIEIFAGIGAFSLRLQPLIRINGQEVKANDETGVASDTLTANSRPGKYKIPIVITITRPDGTQQTITRDLKYTVEAAP